MAEYLTYREAAHRVKRSVRTIKRWRRNGLPMAFDARGRRVVELRALLGWWRARMTADPVHQARLKRAEMSLGSPEFEAKTTQPWSFS